MTVPTLCKTCRHRYNDVEEGHNCRRYDREIELPSGRIMKWPGWDVETAYLECQGKGYEKATFGWLKWVLRL